MVEISPQKQAALDLFVQKLLSGPWRKRVAKVILFGSVARGEDNPASDIDVLVFSVNGLEELRDVCAEAAFEVAMETGEGIEPLVYPLSEYFNPRSYFLYRAFRSGKEVFSVGEGELKQRGAEAEGHSA